jgi:hypothetical protein
MRLTDALQRPATEPPAGHHEARRRPDRPSINSVRIFCEFFARFCLI